MSALHDLSAAEQIAALRSRDLAPADLTEHYLGRIAEQNDRLGAFVEVTAGAARARAAALTAPDGPLWGLPLADKDLTARAGVPTRYGSRAFADFVPEHSDPLALALDAAGAISLGKTSTPEFGLTGYTETQIAPPARDPWDPEHGAGGSSGGAAAAVAAGLLPAAPASDGGGSIRIPSATVGVVGLKPSRGRLPIGSGLDSPGGLSVTGPIARSAHDAALLLDALLDAVPYSYATRAPGSGPFADAAVADAPSMLVGVTTVSPWDDAMDIEVHGSAHDAVAHAIRMLDAAGHAVDDASWSPAPYADMFMTMWRASAARIPVPDDGLDRVQPITAWLAREGRALPAERVLGAYSAATAFERATIDAFSPFDAVLTPALALPPRPIGWHDSDDAERAFAQQCQYAPYSSFVNVAGLPALTVPVTTDPSGHPVSVQLIGRPGGEARILALATVLERARGPLPHPPGW
ncbi:amidase [Microbacterium sp. G2-8]|uniref:amidase n=1 Tax=Microbacterium sp. G2-8 TaxID=2842454 RepID=UPI001C896FFB|nr:amidase [Microbacterium sp. G2-8]